MLTDYETDFVQMAALFNENDFAERYAAERGNNHISDPKGAMADARSVMIVALHRLPVGEEPGSFLRWVENGHKRGLLDLLRDGINLGDDAPPSCIDNLRC